MSFKKTILFIHRWLGFVSGLVVFVVSITGCIFCFQDEIQDALFSYRTVTEQNKPYLPPSALKTIALEKCPNASSVSFINYYGRNRPADVYLSIPKHDDLQEIFIDPYTGKVTHIQNGKNFFTLIEYIHLYLLLPAAIGSIVVGTSVIIFVVLMITGIILWWPKRKTDRKRSFTIKWNGRWRRVNYDLHNVLGFYATGITIILALTGLSICFNWMREGVYTTANLGKTYKVEKVFPRSDSLLKTVTASMPVIDKSFLIAQRRSPAAEMFLLYEDPAKSGTIDITAYAKTLHYGNSDYYYFDKYSGKLLKYLPDSQKSPGMKLNDLNYDIHVGQAMGLTGKILAFSASLICASLPITGFMIWLGKRKKQKSKTPRRRRLPA